MRGFPLLNTLVIVALFALAWWPLRLTLASHEKSDAPIGLAGVVAEMEVTELATSVNLRLSSTAPITSLRIEHLGELIFEGANEQRFEQSFPNFADVSDGLDLWIEATFADQTTHPAALRAEIETEDGLLLGGTIWSDSGEIADSVYLEPTY